MTIVLILCMFCIRYIRIKDSRTSCIYIFAYEKTFSYVYNLSSGAALLYSLDHLSKHYDALSSVRNSKIVLLEAFFTMHSVEVGVHILETCKQSNVVTAFNICGEYVPIRYPNAVIPFVQNCDIVVGNKLEFTSLCQVMDIATDDFKRALTDVHKIMLSHNSSRKFNLGAIDKHRKILLVTDGQEPVQCVIDQESKILEYHLSPIDPTQVKDTTGAGDSFLAGVLYGFLEEFPIEKC